MNNLQKMQESCEEFDCKTGNVTWFQTYYKDVPSNYNAIENGLKFSFWLDHKSKCFVFRCEAFMIAMQKIKATTAKEAAIEALELVKSEAQKLVDALSEPKDIDIKIPNMEEIFKNVEKDVFGENVLGLESEPKEPFWTKIDPENYPKGKLLLGNFEPTSEIFGETTVGEIILFMKIPMCHYKLVTHYHDFSQYPKP